MEQHNPDLPQPGKAGYKSSNRATFLLGVTMNDEVLPPCIVLMSTAQHPSISGELQSCLQQVGGKFGGPNTKFYDPIIAFSDKGGVKETTFVDYMKQVVQLLYPNAQDIPGQRVVVKLDCGPGRYNEEFLLLSRACGIYYFPGLPNGTELTQEMDQLFHLVKSIMGRNRAKLYDKRYEAQGTHAKLTLNDMPKFLHGGTYEASCNNFFYIGRRSQNWVASKPC